MAKNANIKITTDPSQAEKGLDKITKDINKLANTAESKLSKLSKVGNAITGLQSSVSLITGAFSTAKETILELTDAYNTQKKAETMLEVAVKNNPYLDESSVQSLKDYASQMQNIGTVGDETLLPMMAKLAAAGRTQDEIQKIISASLDVSASGAMSLESAVNNLNKTFNGTAGELGETNIAIKNLTAEELKAGKAVEIMANQYKGFMAETTKQTGSITQLSNAWGDFKESLGEGLSKLVTPVANFFTKFVSGITSVINALNNFKDTMGSAGTATGGDSKAGLLTQKDVDAQSKRVDEIKRQIASTQAMIDNAQKKAAEEGSKVKESAKKALEATKEYNEALEKNSEGARQYKEVLSYLENAKTRVEELTKTLDEQKTHLKELQEANKTAYSSARAAEIESLTSQIKSENKELDKQNSFVSKYQKLISSIYAPLEKLRQATIAANLAQVGASSGVSGQIEVWNDELGELNKQLLEAQKNEAELKKRLENQNATVAESTPTKPKKTGYVMTDDDKKVASAVETYYATIEKKRKEIEANKAIGSKTYGEGEAEKEQLDTMYSAYVTFWETVGTLGNSAAKKMREEIADYAKSIPQELQEAEEKVEGTQGKTDLGFDAETWIKNLEDSLKPTSEILKEQLSLFDEQYNLIVDNYAMTEEQKLKLAEEYGEKRKQLELDIETAQLQSANKVISYFSTGFSNLYSTLSSFSELAQTQAENEATVATTALEKQFNAGEISEEEYYEEKERIEKKAAEKSYKLQMWAWSMQLLQIGASTAQSIVQTLADDTIKSTAVRIALAATVGALGAAQLATAISNKPIPPSSYATGGIVGGSSYSGDKVQANVNSGEMILNAQQQRQLWQMANGNGAGGLNVEIKNYMGDSAQVSSTLDEGKLTIMVNKIVKTSMQNGEYSSALTSAQNLQNGINYQS